MTDTPATPDPQPTREAIWTVAHHLLLHCPRPSEKQVVALIDRFAAQHSTAALTAERAEARRAALEEARLRLTQIHIDEAPDGVTPAQAANWAMGIAQDEIRALCKQELA